MYEIRVFENHFIFLSVYLRIANCFILSRIMIVDTLK